MFKQLIVTECAFGGHCIAELKSKPKFHDCLIKLNITSHKKHVQKAVNNYFSQSCCVIIIVCAPSMLSLYDKIMNYYFTFSKRQRHTNY